MSRRRLLSGVGTALVALVGVLVTPLAGAQLPLLALTTAVAVGVGAEAHVRLHPRFLQPGDRRFAGYWIGPSFAALAMALAAGRLGAPWDKVLALCGVLLVGGLLYAQDRELEQPQENRWIPLAFALAVYLIAFALFVVLYGAREQIAVKAAEIGLVGMLLAVSLYRVSGGPPARVWLLAVLTGLCLAELSLVVDAWIVPGLLGGAFLLLFFYVMAGLIQAMLDETLTTRLVVEYGLVSVIGLALILSASPWRA